MKFTKMVRGLISNYVQLTSLKTPINRNKKPIKKDENFKNSDRLNVVSSV